ncbi:hypothetical protein [Marinifilum sp.]|uniref:hypothetical protein n=1 Tax=Marinifilum sp. TaxID=2033137 RepID=UPI003BAD807F
MSYIRYLYLEEEKQLIVACGRKVVDRKILVSEFQSMFHKLNIDSPVDVLLDIKNIHLKASTQANKIYTDYFLGNRVYVNVHRVAVLADSPSQVVQTMLFMDGITNLETRIKIFNTEKSASNWLSSNNQNEKILCAHKALSGAKNAS